MTTDLKLHKCYATKTKREAVLNMCGGCAEWWNYVLKFDKEEHKPPVFFDPSRLAKSFNVVYHGDDKFIPDVEEGDLIVFPSYLEHCVPAGYYDTHRVTVAVNLKVSYVADQQ